MRKVYSSDREKGEPASGRERVYLAKLGRKRRRVWEQCKEEVEPLLMMIFPPVQQRFESLAKEVVNILQPTTALDNREK
jgi:hypothetical protein